MEKEFIPDFKQIFYVLANNKTKDFFSSMTDSHIFMAPLVLDSKIFKNKESALKFREENKLKKLKVTKVRLNYEQE